MIVFASPKIGWNGDCFVDLSGNRIHSIYKLYPWEWLLEEEFGEHLIATHPRMQWIEPIWKMVASNTGILGILWEIFPDHPLLLEAHIDNSGPMVDYVKKPRRSLEAGTSSIKAPAGWAFANPIRQSRTISAALSRTCFDIPILDPRFVAEVTVALSRNPTVQIQTS